MPLDAILIFSVAGMFALMGAGSVLAPDKVTKQFGMGELSVDGRNEVRAVYGGFGLAMAAVLVVAGLQPDWKAGIIVAIAAALGGMAVGRLISAVIDLGFGKTPLLYFIIEIVGAAVLLAAL